MHPNRDDRSRDYVQTYHELMARSGVTPDLARAIMRTNTTAIGSVMVHRGEADSMICGTFGQYLWHLNYVEQVLGSDDLKPAGALSLMILEDGPLFIADTHIHARPTPDQVAQTVISAARHVRRFGIEPKIALCSGSEFGNLDSQSGRTMRGALQVLDGLGLDFQYEGEMHTDSALDPDLRGRVFPQSRLQGQANVLIYANTDADGATRNILTSKADELEAGPSFMGMGNRPQNVTPAIGPRGLLNLCASAVPPATPPAALTATAQRARGRVGVAPPAGGGWARTGRELAVRLHARLDDVERTGRRRRDGARK